MAIAASAPGKKENERERERERENITSTVVSTMARCSVDELVCPVVPVISFALTALLPCKNEVFFRCCFTAVLLLLCFSSSCQGAPTLKTHSITTEKKDHSQRSAVSGLGWSWTRWPSACPTFFVFFHFTIALHCCQVSSSSLSGDGDNSNFNSIGDNFLVFASQ